MRNQASPEIRLSRFFRMIAVERNPLWIESETETLITVIVAIGLVTIIYTLLGGMEAVVWTDVMQSVVMIAGVAFCAYFLSREIFAGPEPLIQAALANHKFSLGGWDLSLSTRTIWVMII